MIRALLIDDEADGLAALKMALERYCPEIIIEGTCDKPLEAVEAIQSIHPDLVFLDVQMPQLSGFDILKQFQPPFFEVIFVSAYDQYAIKAIKFSALDYLLKPIDIDELMQAVQKIKGRLSQKNSTHQYQSVLNNIQHKAGKIEKLAVPSLEGIDFFETDKIIYCHADGSYTRLYLTGGEHRLVTKNLKDFENLLAASGFCRVHHSYLINLQHVRKYIKGEGGYVILSDGHQVDISRRKKEEFLAQLSRL